MHYAHSKKLPNGTIAPKDQWEPLFTPFGEVDLSDPTKACSGKNGAHCPHCGALEPQHGHLNKVASLAANFTKKIGLEAHGNIAGLLHDVGKFSNKFQSYIASDSNEKSGGDHSTAGAALIREGLHKPYVLSSYLISISIACHHSGLIDLLTPRGDNGYSNRFIEEKQILASIRQKIQQIPPPEKIIISNEIEQLRCKLQKNKATPFEMGLFTKIFFSSLIDADRTATIAFCEGKIDSPTREWSSLIKRFNLQCQKYHTLDSEINIVRSQISDVCFNEAERPQGIYRLSLPTGSGKTLTSLRFALKHAELNDLEQIIFVVPYTTIIEQNAQEARKYLEQNDFVVLEHHSNLSNEIRSGKKTVDFDPYEKFSENWDAPIIFTTMVQFMNAIYQDGTKSSRRFHRLAKSVIIFDEIQTLPLKLTHLFNRAANFLAEYCQSTLILCTATQPRIDKLPNQKAESIRFTGYPDLIKETAYPKHVFDRYILQDIGKVTISDLSEQIISSSLECHHILAVVNTRDTARYLFQLVRDRASAQKEKIKVYFLSTDLCPLHRKERITKLTKLSSFDSPQKVICISTNLIEAGVDLDFAQVYRASCPLDSLIQSAGRCNRHNKRKITGKVFHFELVEESLPMPLKYISVGAQITRSILRKYSSASIKFTERDIDSYFNQLYEDICSQTTINPLAYPVKIPSTKQDDILTGLLGSNTRSKKNNIPTPHKGFCQSFKTAGKLFEVIPEGAISILVPYKEGKKLINKIRNTSPWELKWSLIREAQIYSISIFKYIFDRLYELDAIETLNEEKKIYALHESNYDIKTHTGLNPKQVFLSL